jgi:16S rRNA (guanine(966)-N(2))-methyltransferase RsmD
MILIIMRIISGFLKGRKIVSPKGLSVRPTSDKVREAIFDILQFQIEGCEILDLFAGTGCFGIEAISRRAKKTFFIECEKSFSSDLVSLVKKLNISDSCEVLNCDFQKGIGILKKRNLKFDIIFADPPYNKGYVDLILFSLSGNDIIKEQGLVIIEHSKRENAPPIFGFLQLFKKRTYGDTFVSIYRKT